ncbi:hypothetical protein HNQ94_003231 [Salirhabdus euzebyi]|uniref:Uncharacterized protein n=1 Tax=Salirhabdus euzebyi TaxID=394506 RepID=A0A841Q902_9BACI|nr:hypothetical protein [Salirhabdus euzebyi]MBB6454742.1 hypothetical protein [Salirhabdus euzebyi]
MRAAFHKIFWGLIIVLVEINIEVIDILPDPLGYYLIFSGIQLVLEKYPIGKKASYLAFALIFISIPTIFIPRQNAEYNHLTIFSTETLYTFLVDILHIVIVFYLFQLMLSIAKEQGEKELYSRTLTIFKLYIIITLITMIISPFALHISKEWLGVFIIIPLLTYFVMEIIFLVLVRRFGKIQADI